MMAVLAISPGFRCSSFWMASALMRVLPVTSSFRKTGFSTTSKITSTAGFWAVWESPVLPSSTSTSRTWMSLNQPMAEIAWASICRVLGFRASPLVVSAFFRMGPAGTMLFPDTWTFRTM